jgi:glutamate synthase (NADPH) large chain
LREHFTGAPDHVVNLMTFLAEETRQILASLGASSLEDIIGRADLLDQVSRGAAHLDDLDLNPILIRAEAGERPRRSTRKGRNSVEDTLDQRIMPEIAPFLERREKMQLSYPVKNTDRAIGARISSHIVRNFKNDELCEGHLTIRLTGSAGQSLGAFSARGLKLIVDGEANDYVGKGLSGATIVVRPETARAGAGDAVIGNTCLYGATSGALFAAGRAGGRFAVRNSGAVTVIEGCSANGCEYMTGGVAVILGRVGANFAAGMTGGQAYVFDEALLFEGAVNPDSVAWRRFAGSDDDQECRALIERHWLLTRSPKARGLLDDWSNAAAKFWVIEPLETLARKQIADAAKSA